MSHHQTVIKRGGVGTAVAHGLFGMLTTIVVCSIGVGVYALNLVDRRLESVLGLGQEVLVGLPETLTEVRQALPPALADALNDERTPDYRETVDLNARLVPGDDQTQHLVIHAHNQGERTVTLMALRVVLVDANDVPVRSTVTYAATPLTIDHEWRGPILPGSLRECSLVFHHCPTGLKPKVEITDIRVWTGPKQPEGELAAAPLPAPAPVATIPN